MKNKFKNFFPLQIRKLDFIILFVFSFICYMLYGHQDLLFTAQRSYNYLDGNIITFWGNLIDNISHFYTKSWQMAGDYGANYLPSTFIIFAIWNIPYKLFMEAPAFWGDWNLFFILWNKLLPIIIYMFCGCVIYKICIKIFDFEKAKSKIVVFIFYTAPLGFFSQFFFCQYDIFTVFFMLLGIYYLFSQNSDKSINLKFILCFSIATTFKYYAIIIFVILIVLKEKKFLKLVLNCILVLTPVLCEMGFYLITDYDSFTKSVLQFGVLEYVDVGTINIGFASINILPFVLCILIALAYTKVCKTKEELFSYFIYYSCGVCFALFGLMTWHPQWLIFAIPFWSFAIAINENSELMLWLDTCLAIIFYAFVTKSFVNNVDQSLFKYGIFSSKLRYISNLDTNETMSRLYFGDINLLFTLMVAIFLTYFIFSHPKRTNLKLSLGKLVNIARLRFILGALGFLIPSLLCLPAMFNQEETLWRGWISDEGYDQTEFLNSNDDLTQNLYLKKSVVHHVTIYTNCPNGKNETLQLTLTIKNSATDEIINVVSVDSSSIQENGDTVFTLNNCVLEDEGIYSFIFSTNTENCIKLSYRSYSPGFVRSDYATVNAQHLNDSLNVKNDILENTTLSMMLSGKQRE